MRVIITGGSGFIGAALTKALLERGHEVIVLTRNPQAKHLPHGARALGWDSRATDGWADEVARVDAVVNLAGESIGSGPWNAVRKARILASRVDAGRTVAEAIRQASPRPKVLVQASAVGFYGPRGAEPVTEESGAGDGYLTDICKEWEASSQPVEELGVRRVIIRTGVVLSAKEGALPRMLLPFRLFVGGPLGNGRQGLPWIHPDDEAAAICFLLENENARGVYNLSAPQPLSNADFGRVIARELKRPYWLPVPAFALKLLLGEMSTLVLDGQFMLPKRLLEAGFKFKYETAEAALRKLI